MLPPQCLLFVQSFRLLDAISNELLELFPKLKRRHMAERFMYRGRNSTSIATEVFDQHFSVHEAQHLVLLAVQYQYAFTSDIVGNLLQLFGGLVMETGGVELANKACAAECPGIHSFAELPSGKSVAVGGERLDDVFGLVGTCEPLYRITVAFYFGELIVQRFGNDQIDAVLDVVEEWDRSYHTRCCRYQVQATYPLRYECGLVMLAHKALETVLRVFLTSS